MKAADIDKALELREELRSGKEKLESLAKVRTEGLAAVARQGYGVSITIDVQYAGRSTSVTIGPKAYEPVLQLLMEDVSSAIALAEAGLHNLGVEI